MVPVEIASALEQAISPFNLLLALTGVMLGTVIGALPGLSATMAIAVLVPFAFAMEAASGLIMPGAIYTGAILVNTPGTLRRSQRPLTAVPWRGAATGILP